MTLALFLDVALIVLLAVTIGYAVSLNRKLIGLRRNKAEMEKLAATFAQATVKADGGIGRLKANTDALQTQSDKAQVLRDDLAFLLERANTAADRLEAAIRASRAKTQPSPVAAAGPRPSLRRWRRRPGTARAWFAKTETRMVSRPARMPSASCSRRCVPRVDGARVIRTQIKHNSRAAP